MNERREGALQAVLAACEPEQRVAVAQLLGMLAHDFRNHIGTVSLEQFSLDRAVQRITSHIDGPDVETLTNIASNLRCVAADAQELQEWIDSAQAELVR